MRKIKLTNSKKYALIDKEDFDLVGQYSWRLSSNGYAVRQENRKNVYMHRIVAGTPREKDTDHANGDKLDNRRENLRICTRRQNSRNRKIVGGSKGVHFFKRVGKWTASIRYLKRSNHLGYFASKEEAMLAYDRAARKYFGEFARTNEINQFN